MAPHLQINQRDLSVFVRVQHEDGLDPADPEYSEPQFSGSPAFSEGAAFVGDAVGNREIVVPLFLSAESEADLHQLIRDINQELTRGAVVEYASSASAEVTHFDLERGRLEVDYKYWISRAARARATLRLWTRPYGHTGTSRLIASVAATSIARVQATQIAGDIDARVSLKITNGAGPGVVVAGYGVKYPVASGYTPNRGASALTALADGVTASVFGASGRMGSQAIGFQITPTTTNRLLGLPLRMQDAGRYRLLVSFAASLANASGVTLFAAREDTGAQITQPAISLGSAPWGWQDLGEYTVEPSTVDQRIGLFCYGASGATAVGTYPVRIDALLSIPVDQSAGILTGDYSTDFSAASGNVWHLSGVGDRLSKLLGPTGYRLDLSDRTRGGPMTLPPIPSGAPSGAAEITVFNAVLSDNTTPAGGALGNSAFEVAIAVNERFTFLR